MHRLVLVAVLGLLVACAPAAPSAPSGGAAAPSATSAPAAAPAAGQPVKGGTLVFASPIEPGSMDPRLQNDTAAFRINELVYNGLTTIDQNLEPQPDLAEKIEQPDPTTWVFTLRKGVKFHDGSELTAEDVKATFDTMLNPDFKSPRRALYDAIKQVHVTDSYPARLTSEYAEVAAEEPCARDM